MQRNDFQRDSSQGDIAIASQRLEIIRNFALLDLNQSVLDLAEQLLQRSNLNFKAIFADWQKRQVANGRKLVSLQPKQSMR